MWWNVTVRTVLGVGITEWLQYTHRNGQGKPGALTITAVSWSYIVGSLEQYCYSAHEYPGPLR